jgi:hypothetical protein
VLCKVRVLSEDLGLCVRLIHLLFVVKEFPRITSRSLVCNVTVLDLGPMYHLSLVSIDLLVCMASEIIDLLESLREDNQT